MASLLITKKLSSVSSLFLSPRQHNLTILAPLFHFSTQTQQKENLPFMAQYLISSFGFSEDRALRVAYDKNFIPIKTSDRPESVIGFLKDTGLTDIQIKTVISWSPHILHKNVNKTLEPCARKVINGGFNEKALLQLILNNPVALSYKNLLSRLQFWRKFLGDNEDAFLKFLKNRMPINLDIEKKIIPRMKSLREYGWSEEEMQNIVKKYPAILTLPEEKVKSKMNFYVKKARFKLKYIVDRPYLLAYGLEKRLVPRHHVLGVLKSKGLLTKCRLHTAISAREMHFVKRFIEPYEKEVPELAMVYNALLKKTYNSACAEKSV